MPNKGQRSFKLSVQKDDGTTLVIRNPFTLEFTIERNNMSSVNTAEIRIYNLSKRSRNHIRRDLNDFGVVKKIRLEAGYGDRISTIFQGTISQGYSTRQGVNSITTIISKDGGWQAVNSIFSKAFPNGTEKKAIVDDIAAKLAKDGIATGAIGKVDGKISRGVAVSGSSFDALRKVIGENFFIDNETLHVLSDSESLKGNIIVINAKSGLLNTPTLERIFVTFDILLEPKLKVGQRIKLDSNFVDKDINTVYKIVGVNHKGVISEAVNGACVTTVKCLPGDFKETDLKTGVEIK